MAHCEALQHSNANASYNHRTSSKDSALLVSNMFQFFVSLCYEKSNAPAEGGAPNAPSTVLSLSEVRPSDGANDLTNNFLWVNFSRLELQVVHLAEMLAAGGVDVDSVVVPALAPLVIDIYVQKGARYRPAMRAHVLNSPQEQLVAFNVPLAKELP